MQSLDSRLRLRHLQCFLAVAEHRSVQEAARVLNQTSSAVSKSLSELETILGAPLIIRHRRGSELTPAGTQFLGFARQGMDLIEDGVVKVWGQTQSAPHLRIGILPTTIRTLIPGAMSHLLKHEPQLEISIQEGSNQALIKRLHDQELDLIVGRIASPDAMSGLKFEQLYNEPLKLAARKDHPLLKLGQDWMRDFAAYPLILPSVGTSIRRAADLFLLAQELKPSPQVIQTISNEASLVMTQEWAIWVAPRGATEYFYRRGELDYLPIDTSSTTESVGITTRRDADYKPLVQQFVQALKEQAWNWDPTQQSAHAPAS